MARYAIMPNGSDVTLRTAEPRDIERVAELALEVFGEDSYRPFAFRQWMAISPDGLILAERGAELVGYALAAVVRGGEAAWALTLCVRPEVRARGVGRALMRAIIERVKGWDAKMLLLTVAPGNTSAVRLFRSLGFAQIEVCDDYFGPHQTRMEMAIPVG
jgi:ribosomal protein S18 acetylase RimI-like enzyme